MYTVIKKGGSIFLVACLAIFLIAGTSGAEMSNNELRMTAMEEQIQALKEARDKDSYIQVKYKRPGFELKTSDGLFSTKLVWRAQLRYTNPHRSDPRSVSSFNSTPQSNFEARRLRMKIGGHGYKPWIKYYFEVDLQPSRDFDDASTASSARVIDYRITLQPYKWLGLRVGQWKIDFNRERVDSSGRQTFVERSIVNRQFTIDRQVGAMLRGRLFAGTLADMRYYAGVFNGEGRSVNNDDSQMMWVGRLQWNFFGRDLAWRQSDTDYTEKPTGSLAFAAAYNEGRCTRWSSSGCGNLSGLAAPAAASRKQFKIDQYVQEFAFKWRGLAIQEEFHWKNVLDRSTQIQMNMKGAYAQIGYFLHGLIQQVPKQLEVAFRYAFVDEPNSTNVAFINNREEFTVGANWFFASHNNKVTVDYSHLSLDDALGGGFSDDRVRVQWDVSF